MADILFSNIAGGVSLPKLAPNLTYVADKSSSGTIIDLGPINPSGSLTTMLSLIGRWSISYLQLTSMINETNDIKLTVDGVVVWDSSFSSTSPTYHLFGSSSVAIAPVESSIQCNSSFLLELKTLTDTSVFMTYLARPII